jgi:hypothetical protein
MTAHGLGMLRGVDREHLFEKISSRSVRHKGGQMGLKPNQLRCRALQYDGQWTPASIPPQAAQRNRGSRTVT